MDPHAILSLARLATAALVGTLCLYALRAFVAARRRNLLALAVGAGVLAAGYLAEGLLVELGRWSMEDATVLESISTLVGASLLVSSLFLRERARLVAALVREAPTADEDASTWRG